MDAERLEHAAKRTDVGRVATALEPRDRGLARADPPSQFALGHPERGAAVNHELRTNRPRDASISWHLVEIAAVDLTDLRRPEQTLIT